MKTNRNFLLAATLVAIASLNVFAQESEEFKPSGKVSGTMYSDYSTKFTTDEVTAVGFNIERAYFGYTYYASEKLFAEVKIDISSPTDVTHGSLKKRVAHIRNIYGTYALDESTSLSFGMINILTCDLQEKMWGYRYIYKSFMDEHSFGFKSDVGVLLQHKVNEQIEVDIAITNGEGYASVQKDLDFLYGFGATIKPTSEFTFRVYGDYSNLSHKPITLGSFISINPNESNWQWNAEYNYKINNNGVENHNLAGLSLYTTYAVNSSVNIFTRFDKLWSNVLEAEYDPWNQTRDGNAIIGGIEYKPSSNLRVALSYNGWIYDNSAIQTKNRIGVFTELKF